MGIKSLREIALELGHAPSFAEYREAQEASGLGPPQPFASDEEEVEMSQNTGKPGHCIICGRPHGQDPDVESFCSQRCRQEYNEIMADQAEEEARMGWHGGPPDTASYEGPRFGGDY